MIKLIVGLGNKDQQYRHTRHNVGFDFVDTWMRLKGNYYEDLDVHPNLYSSKSSNIKLLKPNTGMNNSGIVIRQISHALEIQPQDTVVVYDDMDFQVGQSKVKVGGSDGRHNGMKSVLANVSDGFTRIRVGIGKPPSKEQGIDFVLGQFTKSERTVIDKVLEHLVEVVDVIVLDGPDKAMALYNNKVVV